MFGLDKPKLLEEVGSKYSGKLEVMSGYGYKYVSTSGWTQTGGIIEDVWKSVLKKYGRKQKSWLILGLASGTVAKLISKKYKPAKMVGVEIDPAMIRIGKEYFGLDKIPNLEIMNIDAQQVKFAEVFDFVLVDMYLGDKLPEFVYSPKFLLKLKKHGQTIVFNHLFYEDWMKHKAERLVVSVKKIWPNVRLMRVLTNLMIICA